MSTADARVAQSCEVFAVVRNRETGEIVADLGLLTLTSPAERARRAMAGLPFVPILYQSADYKE